MNKEELIKRNMLYEEEHCINDVDVEMVNNYIELFQNACNTEMPVYGDKVIYTTEYGKFFSNALISSVDYENKLVTICEQGCGSVYKTNGNKYGFGLSVSGGAFKTVSFEKLKSYGKSENIVWDFGFYGRCRANGAIYFPVPVKRWICNLNECEYSTKDYDCCYVYYSANLKEGDRYHYKTSEGIAWENKEDFQAWLRTYRGVIDNNNGYNVRVWTYKEIGHHVSPEYFEKIDAPVDIFLMNGAKRKCKRIYHEDTHTIDKYYVWYHDNNDLKGDDFYNRMSEQNKEIKAYEVDYFSNKTEQIAREEIESGKVKMPDIDKHFDNVIKK